MLTLTPPRLRLLLFLIVGVAAMLLLSSCGQVDDDTALSADGSGTQTLRVVVADTDMESIEGGAGAIETIITEHNPGLEYQGQERNGTDTIFTLTLAFTDTADYAAKAQPVLEAGEITTTPEVTLTPPSPPFSSGYTMTRNFTAKDLTRWAALAIMEAGIITDSSADDPDDLIDAGESTVTIDEQELSEDTWADSEATVWTNAESVAFDSVGVVTEVVEDGSFQRTLVYELSRETYLDAKDAFDTFFDEATPEGGELTPAGEAGTTWTIAFPAGTAEQIGTWTDAALATEGSVFTLETAPSTEDPFTVETRVVDTIDCVVACGEYGYLDQVLVIDGEEMPLSGGTEPEVLSRTITFSEAVYDLTVNPEGGGELTMALSLPADDDAVVTEENVVAFLGEGTERSEADDVVTYTVTARGADSAEFVSALQKAGFEGYGEKPVITVSENDDDYLVYIELGVGAELGEKLSEDAAWTITGDGLRPTGLDGDELGNAALGEDSITASDQHAVVVMFSAERTGLSPLLILGLILALGLLSMLIAAGVLAFIFRARIAKLFKGGGGAAAAADAATTQQPPVDGAAQAGDTAVLGDAAQPAPGAPSEPTAPQPAVEQADAVDAAGDADVTEQLTTSDVTEQLPASDQAPSAPEFGTDTPPQGPTA